MTRQLEQINSGVLNPKLHWFWKEPNRKKRKKKVAKYKKYVADYSDLKVLRKDWNQKALGGKSKPNMS